MFVSVLAYYRPLTKWFEMEDMFETDKRGFRADNRPILLFLSPLTVILVLLQIAYWMRRSQEQKHRDLLERSGNKITFSQRE